MPCFIGFASCRTACRRVFAPDMDALGAFFAIDMRDSLPLKSNSNQTMRSSDPCLFITIFSLSHDNFLVQVDFRTTRGCCAERRAYEPCPFWATRLSIQPPRGGVRFALLPTGCRALSLRDVRPFAMEFFGSELRRRRIHRDFLKSLDLVGDFVFHSTNPCADCERGQFRHNSRYLNLDHKGPILTQNN